jgi:antitoxin HicB
MRRPYARVIIPETDGTYRAEILEFPGCIATGDTPAEALEALEDVGTSWLEGVIENGQPVPAPVEESEFSGRLVLRMPKSLHKKAARMAERDNVSLNQFIVIGLAQYLGGRSAQTASNQITFNTAISQVTNAWGNQFFLTGASSAAENHGWGAGYLHNQGLTRVVQTPAVGLSGIVLTDQLVRQTG